MSVKMYKTGKETVGHTFNAVSALARATEKGANALEKYADALNIHAEGTRLDAYVSYYKKYQKADESIKKYDAKHGITTDGQGDSVQRAINKYKELCNKD